METDVKDVVRECTRASDEGRIVFPEVVGRLMRAGVERYHADLMRHEKTYYLPDGSSEVVPTAVVNVAPAREFSAAGVADAIRASQAGTISYRVFCERVLHAGCVGYDVSLAGRRAVYHGRTGDTHVEWFPQSA
jgi:uncharacterized protein YbcV (DUF1398 family)